MVRWIALAVEVMLEKAPDGIVDPRVAEAPVTTPRDPKKNHRAAHRLDRRDQGRRLPEGDQPIPIPMDDQQGRILGIDELDGTRGSRQHRMLLHRTAHQLRLR